MTAARSLGAPGRPPAPAASSRAWLIGLTAALVGLTALGFGRFAYALLLPLMQAGLGLSYTEAGLVSAANLSGYLTGALAGGTLATLGGARAVVGAALVVAAAGAALTAAGQGAGAVASGQFLVGLGAGGAMVPSQNLPVVWFPAARRGFASGLPSAGLGLGLVVAGVAFPALLPLEVAGLTGWRLAWATIGAALLAVAALAAGLLRDAPESAGRREPLRAAFRAPGLWHLCTLYLLFGFSYLAYVAFFGAAVGALFAWDTAAIGRAWATGGVISIASGVGWGALSDRAGRRRAIALAFGVQAIAYLGLGLVPWDGAVYGSVVLWGLTAWAIPSLAVAVAVDHVGPRLVHSVTAVITLVGAVGQMSGPVVTGYVVDRTGSFVPGLVLAAAVAGLGAATALGLAEGAGRPAPGPARAGDDQA